MEFKLSEMGKRIANRRKHFKLTQGELANKLEITNNHLSYIETGRTQPSLILFIRICNELRVTPDYLLMGVMRSSGISQAIIDALEICTDEDRDLIYNIVKYMAERNSNKWNSDNYI